MEKELLLEIINNGIEELKQIGHSFYKEELKDSEIDIAIYKTETLLKEFILLKEAKSSKNRNIKTDINDTSHKIHSEPSVENMEPFVQHPQNRIAEDTFSSDSSILLVECNEKDEKVIGETITFSGDLNKLINLNDRFQFSRELFDNDMNLYKETIEKLNNASGFENAKKIISSFPWNEEDETVVHFMEILTRKFNYNV